MNAPEKHVFPDHTTLQWSLAVSSFAVGGPFGALLGQSLRIGNPTLLCTSLT